MTEPVQVKAKGFLESGCRGMVENASFRSVTVKWEVSGGIKDKRV